MVMVMRWEKGGKLGAQLPGLCGSVKVGVVGLELNPISEDPGNRTWWGGGPEGGRFACLEVISRATTQTFKRHKPSPRHSGLGFHFDPSKLSSAWTGPRGKPYLMQMIRPSQSHQEY